MKHKLTYFLILFFLSMSLYAQKDTVNVPGYYESGSVVGTLNEAIDAARADGTINNKVFKLTPFEVYVLSRSIFMGLGENLEIVAPKPGADQNSAPPQIVWTEEEIDRAYIIQTYGDLTLKNVWVRYADFLGGQVSCSITFVDSSAQGEEQDFGYFEGVIFDYCPIGSDAGGAITVQVDHFNGEFKDCYFRNLSDNHFQYYGRAISFPYQSTGYHYDNLLFENCTFSNLSRIVMQEGNEFAHNIYINHCTLINSIEWVVQGRGWWENLAITNSIMVNPYLMGYRPIDVCDDGQDFGDFEDGLCGEPGGGLINGMALVDSFGFTEYVDFTDLDRGLYIGHNAYMYQDWMLDWYVNCPAAKELYQQRNSYEIRLPSPMMGEDELAIIDSLDGEGNKMYPNMNVDWETIYEEDPGFVLEPINYDTLKLFIEGKWYTGLDIDWSYNPNSGFLQQWPLPENLAYTNETYKTAAMGGLPLGDLNWYPAEKAAWEAQRDTEWENINNLLSGGSTSVEVISGEIPTEYELSQNYPNPFNPTTDIKYSIPMRGDVSLTVYNALGQEVANLFNGVQDAGNYVATFNAAGLSSGVYFYELKAGEYQVTKKLVLMK